MSRRPSPPSRPGSSTLALALSLAATLAGAALVVADEVVLVPNATVKGSVGGRVRGTIQSESPSEVVVKLGASTINVPTGEIASIHYDNQPPSLALAESRESANQLAEAADLYKKAAGEAAGKPFIEQAAKFRQAQLVAELALGDPSRAAEAITLLEAGVRAYPTSRHVVAALDSLARLQLQKGDYAAVEKTLAEMARQPQSADRAAVLRTKVFDKKGEHDRAIAEYDKMINASPEGSVRRREAQLGKAESLVGLKKYADAEANVREVIKAAPPEDYQAQAPAYNTLGDCRLPPRRGQAQGRVECLPLHRRALLQGQGGAPPRPRQPRQTLARAQARRPGRRRPDSPQAGLSPKPLGQLRPDHLALRHRLAVALRISSGGFQHTGHAAAAGGRCRGGSPILVGWVSPPGPGGRGGGWFFSNTPDKTPPGCRTTHFARRSFRAAR
jgi:tetratricopeptide (TPR) repeat protein